MRWEIYIICTLKKCNDIMLQYQKKKRERKGMKKDRWKGGGMDSKRKREKGREGKTIGEKVEEWIEYQKKKRERKGRKRWRNGWHEGMKVKIVGWKG